MDDAVIFKLFEDQKELIMLNSSGTRATITSEINRIDEMDNKRNNRIGSNEKAIKQIRKETGLFRWMHRNPTKAIVVIVVIFGGLAYGYNKIDIRKGLENKGIYFKDTTKNIVERNPAR